MSAFSFASFSNFAVCLLISFVSVLPAAAEPVRVTEGTISIPTYDHPRRDLQPPLFDGHSGGGMYPFTTYLTGWRDGDPKPQTYKTVELENEYLKLTYVPEFGGRIFSVYDKVRHREMFYRNDVIKPAHYNPRGSWQQSGMELTGPHDLHMLTLHGEPFWSNRVLRSAGGSASLYIGQSDPVYHMKVNLVATLHPGVAAIDIAVFCYNARDGRMPQMFWISAALPGTPKTEFIYPMTRTIGHTTAEIADWPVFNGVDYSWDRNNRNMLGVFGIDIYDDFQGAYQHDTDYGVFRYADRRVVQGMKMWTFGYGPSSKIYERGYTDNAGPYVEVQSGRMVWDGHYEWVEPHKFETWHERWVPVSGIGGLTTIRADVALNLKPGNGAVSVGLSSCRPLPGARITVRSAAGLILSTTADLVPGKPFNQSVPAAGSLQRLTVSVADSAGRELLNYTRPDSNPGRKEYTPFTRPLETPAESPRQLSIEELVLRAESKLKELKDGPATELLAKALAIDPGYSRAHLLIGIRAFNSFDYPTAIRHLEKAIERDPYLDEAYYYLATARMKLGQDASAARNLYYIWPGSAYYPDREYNLGRIAYENHNLDEASAHFEQAVTVNGYHLSARAMLALIARQQNRREDALRHIADLERLDPTSTLAQSERWLLTGASDARAELLRLMGGQSQEAIETTTLYRRARRYGDAARILKLVEAANRDPFGTSSEFYYVLAFCLAHSGAGDEAAAYLAKARAARENIDRFPYREESLPALEWAVKQDPRDSVARFYLACLDYYLNNPSAAIGQLEAAVDTSPHEFRLRRTLGLAYAAQDRGIDRAAAQLEKAVALNPTDIRTINDLSEIYARAGRLDDQIALLNKTFARNPADDSLAEQIIGANLLKGSYADAEKIVASHRFQPRHRVYSLRDKYRAMQLGLGAAAFHQRNFAEAVRLFRAALTPPVSLGVDDFAAQTSPRISYLVGRSLEAEGKSAEARTAYEQAVAGRDSLSGDRDSWSSENFYIVLALDRLGRKEEAAKLQSRFVHFASSELDSRKPGHRVEACYLLALVAKREGNSGEAKKLLEKAVAAEPDAMLPRLELRGDVIDPIR